MLSSLIRGKHMICKTIDRHTVQIIDDGAIVQRDGRIVAMGSDAEMADRYQVDAVIGSSHQVVLPGFVNSHHHVGLTVLTELAESLKVPFTSEELHLRNLAQAIEPYVKQFYAGCSTSLTVILSTVRIIAIDQAGNLLCIL